MPPADHPVPGPRDVSRWLSAPRYGRYLAVAEGDHRRALDLYLWNARAAAAVLVDVGHVEVALRNSYDRELSRVFPNWATDHHSPAFQRTQGVERARHAQRQSNERNLAQLRRVWPGTSGRLNHDRVVAALPFGFWASLTARHREMVFWTPMLHRAFPHGTRRADVHRLVEHIVALRNRLAHNEPVFTTRTGLSRRMAEVDDLLNLISPAIARYVGARSTVRAALAECPIDGLLDVR